MSFRQPKPQHPHPYYPSGVARQVKKPTIKGKLRKGKKGRRGMKGVYARERSAEDAFKFGQIRSGLEGIATFSGEKKPSREQVASDFLSIHVSALKNKERDEAEVARSKTKKTQELEERSQSFFEANATKQLELQERSIRNQEEQTGRRYEDTARRDRMIGDVANQFFHTHAETERRSGEREERLFNLLSQQQQPIQQGEAERVRHNVYEGIMGAGERFAQSQTARPSTRKPTYEPADIQEIDLLLIT